MSEQPLVRVNNAVSVYGVPVATSWWRMLEPGAAQEMCQGKCGGPAQFASMVAAALEELEQAVVGGLQIADRNWADVGGGRGHYAIALSILGARSVTLVEPRAPDEIARAVLEAAGVEVVSATAQDYRCETADSVLLLYVPDVGLSDLKRSTPNAGQLVVDACRDIKRHRFFEAEWEVLPLHGRVPFFMLGEGGAVTRHNRPWSYSSPWRLARGQRPLSNVEVALVELGVPLPSYDVF